MSSTSIEKCEYIVVYSYHINWIDVAELQTNKKNEKRKKKQELLSIWPEMGTSFSITYLKLQYASQFVFATSETTICFFVALFVDFNSDSDVENVCIQNSFCTARIRIICVIGVLR